MKWLVAALLLLAAPVAAYDEADAPGVDARIVQVGHAPDPVTPGTQWEGTIKFVPGHNVTAVRYQICKVGLSCFAGPTLADRIDQDTWHFRTEDYTVLGRQIDWGINEPGESGDWRVGVQYVLYTEGDDIDDPFGGELVPHGVDVTSPECDAIGWEACAETHYFAFDMEGRPRASADAPAPFLLVPLVGALLWARSRRA